MKHITNARHIHTEWEKGEKPKQKVLMVIVENENCCTRCGKEESILITYGFHHVAHFCRTCRREWEKRIRIAKEKHKKIFADRDKWHKFADEELVDFILEYKESVVFI